MARGHAEGVLLFLREGKNRGSRQTVTTKKRMNGSPASEKTFPRLKGRGAPHPRGKGGGGKDRGKGKKRQMRWHGPSPGGRAAIWVGLIVQGERGKRGASRRKQGNGSGRGNNLLSSSFGGEDGQGADRHLSVVKSSIPGKEGIRWKYRGRKGS